MAARTRRIEQNDKTREKIKSSQIINRLMDHINGAVELSATQVSAALGLLRKTVPDLSQVDGNIAHSGEITQVHKTAESLPLNDIRSKATENERTIN